MTTKLSITKEINGSVTFALPTSDIKFSTELAAGVAESFTVPVTIKKGVAIFSFEPGASVWVAINNSAVVAVPGVFIATNSELNPTVRNIKAGDVVEVITSQVGIQIGASLYAL